MTSRPTDVISPPHAADFLSRAEAILAAETLSAAELETALRSEMDLQMFEFRAVHLYEGGEYEKLFHEIEKTSFLARQADYFSGFRNGSRDLETYVLPAAIDEARTHPGDGWLRFLHLALVAANFRGLADALANGEILEALTVHGQRPLALDVAAQLADPAARARARAAVLAASPGAPDERDLVRQVEEDLDALSADDARRIATLSSVALEIGPLFRHRWPSWLEPLGPEADEVWEAVVKSWIRRQRWTAPGLLEAVAAFHDRQRLRDLLPALFAEAPESAAAFPDLLENSGMDEKKLNADLRLVQAVRKAEDDPRAARAAWAEFASRPLSWDAQSVELGRGLWPLLAREEIDELLHSVDGAEARAALLIAVLEKESRKVSPEEALEAVRALEDGSETLHWCLQYLTALPKKAQKQVRSLLTSVAQSLYRVRYEAPAEDLALFLDLVARYLPKELGAQTEKVVWSPASRPETLLTLASKAASRKVLERLLGRAEAFAAAVSRTEADGFELRRELLVRLAVRFARDEKDVQSVDRAVDSLLPGEEEDELRSTVIRELLDADEGFRPFAEEIFEGLEAPRLRLLMRLRIENDPAKLAELVRPAALYRGVATTAALDDESHALAALRQVPERPRELARTYLSRVQDPDRRVLGLCELARRALAYQRERYRPSLRDRTAALQPLSEALDALASKERRVALIPELAALGAELGTTRAVAELQEAFLRLLGPGEVAWEVRRDAFESILTRLDSLVVHPVEPSGSHASRCRAAAELLSWLTELPSRADMKALRGRWHDVLPMVMAAAERLGPDVELYLRHPIGTRLCWETFGRKPDLDLSRRLESFVPRRLRSRATPWRVSEVELLVRWDWLTEEQRPVVALCCRSVEERRARAEDLLHRPPDDVSGLEVEALVPLLALQAPDVVLELGRLLPGEGRRESCWRLLRLGGMDGMEMRRWLGLLENRREALEIRVWRRHRKPSSAWARALGELAAGGEADPLDPRTLPLCRALGDVSAATGCVAMAHATVSALGRGGMGAAERVLRLWLRNFLANLAEGGDEPETAIASAMEKASSIPGLEGREYP